jgi:hypothetical protein
VPLLVPCPHLSVLRALRTSHKQHLALLLDRPHAGFLVIFFLFRYEYGFLNVSEHEIAMRVICLILLVSTSPCASCWTSFVHGANLRVVFPSIRGHRAALL